MEIPPVKVIGDNEISNEEASGVRAKVNDKTLISCLRCDYRSDKLHNFRKHYRSMHLPCGPAKPLFCCDISFQTKWEYVQHSMTLHGKPKSMNIGAGSRRRTKLNCEPLRGQGSSYFCNSCGFGSSSKYNTLRHMKVCSSNENMKIREVEPEHHLNIPDSTTNTMVSTSNPLLLRMLNTPPACQEGPTDSFVERFLTSTHQPVSSFEVSSSSLPAAADSRNSRLVSSCATATTGRSTSKSIDSSGCSSGQSANLHSGSSNAYKWPIVGPSRYSIQHPYYPPHYMGLLQQQLLSTHSQQWLVAPNHYHLARNVVPCVDGIRTFQENIAAHSFNNVLKNWFGANSNPLEPKGSSEDEIDDIDVVT